MRRMSAGGRRRRRKRESCVSRSLTNEDPCDMECETGVDPVDRLARKYMRKCTVDSSTESESDINNESSTCLPTTTFSRNVNDLKAQFLDPYDGDSEETSTHSDCSLTGIKPQQTYSEVRSWAYKTQMCSALADLTSMEHPQCCLSQTVSTVLVANDVFMQPLDLEMPLANPSEEVWSCSTGVSQTSEKSMDSGVISDVARFPSGQFVLIGIHPERSTDFFGGAVKAALHQSHLTSGSSCESRVSKPPTEKRKQGFTAVEGAGEKIKRKKQRVAEIK
ncbi:uncharacterized protein LOC144782772 [Lissotriton helveticus]